jgi:hypothetical protein
MEYWEEGLTYHYSKTPVFHHSNGFPSCLFLGLAVCILE